MLYEIVQTFLSLFQTGEVIPILVGTLAVLTVAMVAWFLWLCLVECFLFLDQWRRPRQPDTAKVVDRHWTPMISHTSTQVDGNGLPSTTSLIIPACFYVAVLYRGTTRWLQVTQDSYDRLRDGEIVSVRVCHGRWTGKAHLSF